MQWAGNRHLTYHPPHPAPPMRSKRWGLVPMRLARRTTALLELLQQTMDFAVAGMTR